MKISLRTFHTSFVAITAGLLFAGCGDATAPTSADAIAGPVATFDYQPGCTKSGGLCDMSSALLLEADGDAQVFLWSGAFDAADGGHVANGKLEKIQAKVLNEAGKEVALYNWDGNSRTVFKGYIPKSVFRNANYKVGLQVNISGATGKKGTSVVRQIGVAGYLPDLAAGALQLLRNGAAAPLAPVGLGTTNSYTVAVSNTTTVGGTAPAIGAWYTCVVTIDGQLQVTGVHGFQDVGAPIRYVGPGQVGSCDFSVANLSLGNHAVKVVIVAKDPFEDADLGNNASTGTVVVAGPADVRMTSIARRVTGAADVQGPQLGQITPGSTHEYVAWVEVPAGSLAATATCSVTVPGSPEIVWLNQQVTVAPGAPQACRFTLKFANAGVYAVTATATSSGDPNPANDAVTGTVTVESPVSTNKFVDLVVRSIAPTAPILSGTSVTYTARIGALATTGATETSAAFTCSAAVTRITGGANDPATAGKVELVMAGTASTTADGECTFILTPSAGASAESYRIEVTATPTAVIELASATANNKLSVTQLVEPRLADVTVRSISRITSAGASVPLGDVDAGTSATYSAAIGIVSTNTPAAVPVTCGVQITNTRTGAVSNLVGTTTGSATATSDADCRFTTALASNGDLDESYTIVVTAAPGAGITDPSAANNSASGAQRAIVRVDVAATGVQLSVAGVLQTNTSTLIKGETGDYTATFVNGSTRPATVTCLVEVLDPATGNYLPIPMTSTPATRTIAPGGTSVCTFSYTFTVLRAVTFRASAVPVSPVDSDPSNNIFVFTTTPKSDGKFPGVELANVVATEQRYSPEGQTARPTYLLNPQTLAIRRLGLTFTDSTPNIGTFVLRVKSRSGATPFSEGVLTVPALAAGGAIPVCAFGRSNQPGTLDSFVSVNGHKVSLAVCAQAVPLSGGLQEIFVQFETAMIGDLPVTATTALLESAVTFDVTLEWRLFGSTLWDSASAALQFAVRDTDFGGGIFVKDQTGEVTVIRSGPPPAP